MENSDEDHGGRARDPFSVPLVLLNGARQLVPALLGIAAIPLGFRVMNHDRDDTFFPRPRCLPTFSPSVWRRW